MYKVLIFSNSQYSYLWQIINDKTKQFDEICVCIDNNNINFQFENHIKILYYDSNLQYAARLNQILKKIETDYVLLIHDVDLILNFDILEFDKYFRAVKQNKIDRLTLGVFNLEKILSFEDIVLVDINGINLSSNYLTPYDYAPSLYNRIKLIDFFENFYDGTYKNLEHSEEAQVYFLKHFNCFGIQKNKKIKLLYHRGFVYTTDFNFLHITISGKFMNEENYFDLIDDFNLIKKTYNLNLQIQKYNLSKQEI